MSQGRRAEGLAGRRGRGVGRSGRRRVETDFDGRRVGGDVVDGALVLATTGADRDVVRHARLLVNDRRQPMTVLAVRLRYTNTRAHVSSAAANFDLRHFSC